MSSCVSLTGSISISFTKRSIVIHEWNKLLINILDAVWQWSNWITEEARGFELAAGHKRLSLKLGQIPNFKNVLSVDLQLGSVWVRASSSSSSPAACCSGRFTETRWHLTGCNLHLVDRESELLSSGLHVCDVLYVGFVGGQIWAAERPLHHLDSSTRYYFDLVYIYIYNTLYSELFGYFSTLIRGRTYKIWFIINKTFSLTWGLLLFLPNYFYFILLT